MISISTGEPWQQPLFAEVIPVETILRILHMFCDQEVSEDDSRSDTELLDLTIFRAPIIEAMRRGADYRELPWTARLVHMRLTGQPEGQAPRRPAARDGT